MTKNDYLSIFKKAAKILGIRNILVFFKSYRTIEYFYINSSSNFVSITEHEYWQNWGKYKGLDIEYSTEVKDFSGYLIPVQDKYAQYCKIWIRDLFKCNFIKDTIFHEMRHFWQWLQGEKFINGHVAYLDRNVEVDARLFAEYASYQKTTLLQIAKDKKIKGVSKLSKKDLINKLLGFVPNKD